MAIASTSWQYIDKHWNIQSKEMVLTTYPEVCNDTLWPIVNLHIAISLSFDILCISGCACRTEEFFKRHKHFVNFDVFFPLQVVRDSFHEKNRRRQQVAPLVVHHSTMGRHLQPPRRLKPLHYQLMHVSDHWYYQVEVFKNMFKVFAMYFTSLVTYVYFLTAFIKCNQSHHPTSTPTIHIRKRFQ